MRIRSVVRTAIWLSWLQLLAWGPQAALAGGDSYTFDVSSGIGTVTLDNAMGSQNVDHVHGTPFTFQMLPNGIGQFRFAGDLQFESNELVIGTGDAPISLFSLNDVSLGAGVTQEETEIMGSPATLETTAAPEHHHRNRAAMDWWPQSWHGHVHFRRQRRRRWRRRRWCRQRRVSHSIVMAYLEHLSWRLMSVKK